MTSTTTTTFTTFTFTSYQLSLLAAVSSGAGTATEIREVLSEPTAGQAGASARRRCYETIRAMVGCGVLRSYRLGGQRVVEIMEEAEALVAKHLASARLAA